MTQNLIRGTTQILAGSVPLTALVSGYSVPTANLVDGANFVKKDGSVTMTGALNAGGFKITNGATPTTASDFVIKSYVDALVNGFQLHFVRLAATTNLTLSGEQTIDSVTSSASRVLLTGQTTTSQNGIWLTASGSWTRPLDWAAAASLPEGQYVIVEDEGTALKNTKWFCLNTVTTVVDTTATTFSQDTSGTTYSATGVINLAGTVFSLNLGQGVENDGSSNLRVKLDSTSLTRSSSGIKITPGTAGQVMIGTTTTGEALFTTLTGDVAAVTGAGALTIVRTAGTGFLKYGDMITNEIPSGSINSSNQAFTIANTPQNTSVKVYLNGQRLLVTSDYTISGTTITMVGTPQTGDQLWVDYQK